MKFIGSIHAYDCMGDVNYTCSVRQYSDYEDGDSELVIRLVGSLRGTGEDRPTEWLQDLLISLVESL